MLLRAAIPSDDEAATDFAAAVEQATHGFAPAVLQLFATLDRHHPHEPHYDLPIIGTQPELLRVTFDGYGRVS